MASVFVPGIPAAQGSKTRLAHGAIVESSKRVAPWRERVALVVADYAPDGPAEGAVTLAAMFVFPRPASHLRKDGQLRKGAPRLPAHRPDLDKLGRAVLDALTGVVFKDDGQVVELALEKAYGHVPGVALEWVVQ